MSARVSEPVLPRLLTEAARQLGDDWQLVRQDAASRDEVAQALKTLCSALEAGISGQPPVELGELPHSPLARRLLGLLRERLIRLAAAEASPPESTELLQTLVSFEQVAQQLEPKWDQRFADRLMGPDGLELVVELAHDLRSPLTSILFLGETM